MESYLVAIAPRHGKSILNQCQTPPNQIMKSILKMLANLALLPVAGCIFPGNRDHSDNVTRTHVPFNHPQKEGKQKCLDQRNLPVSVASPAQANRVDFRTSGEGMGSRDLQLHEMMGLNGKENARPLLKNSLN
jgi:hypothetical protein